ncbi:MAG: VOC family protein [Candidatus Lokiarchaeota archaeon]|nr:VOC family protein [Candidatus Lokiarchaeota archaeon]
MANKKKNPIIFDRMLFQVKVKDLDRAKKFYEDLFGFKNIWYMSSEVGWTEFELPGDSPHLGLNTVLEGEEFEEDSGTFTIQVKNLEVTKNYLEEQGVKTTEITNIPDLVSYFNIMDSEGNRVQIVSEPRISED